MKKNKESKGSRGGKCEVEDVRSVDDFVKRMGPLITMEKVCPMTQEQSASSFHEHPLPPPYLQPTFLPCFFLTSKTRHFGLKNATSGMPDEASPFSEKAQKHMRCPHRNDVSAA